MPAAARWCRDASVTESGLASVVTSTACAPRSANPKVSRSRATTPPSSCAASIVGVPPPMKTVSRAGRTCSGRLRTREARSISAWMALR
jgi:hypothetical protein